MIDVEEKRSYEEVNYMLRPKKQIERKIIIEIFQTLNKEIDLSKYIYIGFGSIYYYDFILFHKMLTLDNLLSIDDKSTKKRFEFNRPYDFISFENKISTDFLSEYNWHQNSVIWLDYDHKLKDIVLSDLKIIAKNCSSRDILIITLNAFCDKYIPLRKKSREVFYNEFGTYVSPQYEKEKYFTPKNFPLLLQDVIFNYLGTMCEYRHTKFYKLFSFSYQDRAPMFTIGGIFDDNDELFKKEWDNKFICKNRDIIEINVPILTYCEKFYIDSHIEELRKKIGEIENEIKMDTKIPSLLEKELKMTEKINEKLPFELRSFNDLKSYLDYYRYYPQYYEGII